MVISTIEESEIPEHYMVSTIMHTSTPNGGTGQTVLVASGHHPKCRIARGQVVPLVYATGADIYAVEDGDGTDAATVTASTTVFTPTALTLVAGQVFEKNEAICVNKTTQGSATNVCQLAIQIESIH